MPLAFAEVQPVEFLKRAKALAPTIGKLKIPRGSVVLLAELAAQTDALMQAQIKRHVRTKKRKKEKSDDWQVIKVADAIDCVETWQTDPKVLYQLAKNIVSTILDPALPGGPSFELPDPGEQIIQCIRENALRQDTPRVPKTVSYYARPAKGHGFGRSNPNFKRRT